jgi:hypothetical protein
LKAGSGSAFKSKLRSFIDTALDGLLTEIADSHDFDEKQDLVPHESEKKLDPDQHWSGTSDPDPY